MKSDPRPLAVDAVFDLETEAWERFVLGGILDASGTFTAYRDEDKMLDALLDIPGDVWAHNGGKFDTLWVAQKCRERGIAAQVSLAGSRIIRLQVGRTAFRDSYALVPMALAKAARMVGERKTEVGFPCECGRDCGGYCAIRRSMSAAKIATLTTYLENDCRVLYKVLDDVFRQLRGAGLVVRGTVGSTAWASAREFAGIDNAKWTGPDYILARAGYYGGRVEVYQPKVPAGHRYDIHSSYPAALVRTAVPVGKYRTASERGARAAYAAGLDGIFAATVCVPADTWIPPLPLRYENRIWYPTGRLHGKWTGLELRHAQECGATIETISCGVYWPESAAVLASWCERIWGLRESAATPEWSAQWKWIANSLTGKLAQNPEFPVVALAKENPRACDGHTRACDGVNHPFRCCPHRCTNRCGKWELLDPCGDIFARTAYRLPACGHVQWAAYLTASARIELHRQLTHAGPDAVYCDTDSVYSTRELARNLGDGLGEWGYEGPMSDFHAVAPKVYCYRAGTWRVKAKGIPIDTRKPDVAREAFLSFAAGDAVTTDIGVKTFLRAARTGEGLFKRNTLTRKSAADGIRFGSRILGTDGRTHPVDADRVSTFARNDLTSDIPGTTSEDDADD